MKTQEAPEKREGFDRRYIFFLTPLSRRKEQRRKEKKAPKEGKKNA
jgi:hypothetical protein